MDKNQFDKLIKPLIKIYDEIEIEIIKDILKKLKNYNSVAGSVEWYLEKLTDLGTISKDTQDILRFRKEDIKKVIKSISKNTLNSIDDFDRLKQYYEQGLIDTNPINLFESNSMNNLMNNATKDVFDIMKLIDSKVLEGTDEAYKKILNKAYVETASGIYTYQESIRNALKDFAKEGIRTVHYDNGRTLSIEAVVRRDVITRVNKLVGDINLNNAKEIGTNLVYVNQHEGARVRTPYIKHDYEAHIEWQGKVYMLEGSSEKYGNFYEKTGYGEMLGLKGLNCYHDFRPHFEWESIPERIGEEENREKRELLDKQRTFERKIRQLKREKEVYKQIDKEEYKRVSNKLKITNNQYNTFLDENNLNRDYSREYVIKHEVDLNYNYNEIKLNQKYSTQYLISEAKEILPKDFIRSKVIFSREQENITVTKYDSINKKFMINLSKNADINSIIHEMAHVYEQENKLYISNVKFKFIHNKAFWKLKKKDFEYINDETGEYWIIKEALLDKSVFVNRYQSRLYIRKNHDTFKENSEINMNMSREYFSVGFETYFKNPNLLKKKDKALYNFIKKEVLHEK